MIRFFDIIISISILIILLPVLIMISMGILFLNGRPLLYKQVRIGLGGKKFKILKFRTMKNDTELNEKLRLTNFGKLLRKSSLDELPQFINVLKNDMSIVGPRPLPEIIEKKINRRTKIKRRKIPPGITGLSQINYTGKDRKLEEKIKLDILFINNYTLFNYIKILIKTPIALFVRVLRNKTSIIK